ncbi:MAG: alanine racemase [Deltaproteobacteria bacterium]|nr:alanine racemase [Deltaproteobacteria bacterium]
MSRERIERSGCLSVRNGRLFVEDIAASDIVERFGSPLFVLSEAQLRSNFRRYRDALQRGWPDGPVDILPAFKANLSLAARRVLSEEGAGADVYSPGELAGVLRTGVDPERVSVNGGGKEFEHLRCCVEAGVRITVEDIDEVDLIEQAAAKLGKTARIRLRVKPPVPGLWKPTDFARSFIPIDLGFQVYKSGLPLDNVVDVGRRALAHPHVELVGLHLHAGRHSASLWYWEGLMRHYAGLIADLCQAWNGWRPQEIDVGGGMAAPRDPHSRMLERGDFLGSVVGYPLLAGLRLLGEKTYHATLSRLLGALLHEHPTRPIAPSIEDYAATITSTLRRELGARGISLSGVRLQAEPGRGLYGDAGLHLTRVKVVKRQRQPVPLNWVLTDTTEFFMMCGTLEANRYDVIAVDMVDAPATLQAEVVGHSCGPDRLAPSQHLPEVEPADVLALLDTGAYQDASASNFNAIPRPATVLVCGANAEIVKTAETVDDVFARDVIPERLATSPHASGPDDSDAAEPQRAAS